MRIVITRIAVSTLIWVIRFKRFFSRSKRVSSNTRRSVVDLETWDERSSSDFDLSFEQESWLSESRSSHVYNLQLEWSSFAFIRRIDSENSSNRKSATFFASSRMQILWLKSFCNVLISFRFRIFISHIINQKWWSTKQL